MPHSHREMYTLCRVKITLTEARRYLGRTITKARVTGEPVTITDYGEVVAVLTPVMPGQEAPAEPQAS
jgi:prevent-host-death family protein